MAEVEIKARVRDRSRLLERLNNLGCILSDPIRQEDRIYITMGVPFSKLIKLNNPILRIRIQRNKKIFTLKMSRSDELDNIEHETEIENSDEMDAIIKYLGYVPSIVVVKSRQKGKLGDCEVCVDEVDNLGTFMEIEKIIPDTEPKDKTIEELLKILNELGIGSSDRVLKGYDTLMYEHSLQS